MKTPKRDKKTGQNRDTPRARTPFYEGMSHLSHCPGDTYGWDTYTGHREAGHDTLLPSARASRPTATPSSRIETAGLVLKCAERILANVKAGRIYDERSIAWAEVTLARAEDPSV